MAKIVVEVTLSTFQYQAMYAGHAKNVVTYCLDGRKVQLPLSAFQRFVTHLGVNGVFEVEFDERHKLLGITQLR